MLVFEVGAAFTTVFKFVAHRQCVSAEVPACGITVGVPVNVLVPILKWPGLSMLVKRKRPFQHLQGFRNGSIGVADCKAKQVAFAQAMIIPSVDLTGSCFLIPGRG